MDKFRCFLAVLVIVVSVSCNNNKDETMEYFEGRIDYSYEYDITGVDDDVAKSLIESNNRIYGSRLTEYYKNGNYFRQYYTSGEEGMEYQIYLCRENKLYTKYNQNDTLYVSKCTANLLDRNFRVLEEEVGVECSDGLECDYLETSYDIYSNTTDEIFTVTEKYYYNDNHKMNSNDWTDYKKSFVYETMKLMNAYSISFERIITSNRRGGAQIEKNEMTKSEYKKVEDSRFHIGDELVIVER